MTLVTAAIIVIMYACFTQAGTGHWYLWGIIAAVVLNTGLVLLGSAYVHKMKSDMIRRQKNRDLHKESISETH